MSAMINNTLIDQNEAVREYKQVMIDGLRNSFPSLNVCELEEAINWSILNRYYNGPASINNNYTHKRVDGTVLEVLNYIQSLQPIITSSGVLFKKHKQAVNPLSKMIMGFLKKRKEYKAEMFKFPKGTAEFAKYNLAQLLEKLNANATYGVLGHETSLFYNLYVAEAITKQGKSYIACSIMLFESLLANNVKFNNLDEIITFIHNVVNEKPNRKLRDDVVLDRDITIAECFFKLMNNADMQIWIPTEREMCLVWDYLLGLSQEDINRIYYKNNLYVFCEMPIVQELIIRMLSKLESPFMDPNKPPKEIHDDLGYLLDLIKEYVYYAHFYIDKLDRIEYMQRDVVCITDTDSTIISFDAWYRYILDKVYDIDMLLKHEKFDMVDLINEDEFGDKDPKVMCEIVDPELDYDFYTDEIIEIARVAEPCKLVPQDSLRYSIINIMAYICSDLIVDYLKEYTKLTGSYEEGTKCRMVMKNEFLFSRVLLTQNKKNYASITLVQEGNVVPENARLGISGLPINKSVLSEPVKKRLQNILYEEVLTSSKIDQIKIIKQLAVFEKEIFNNIMSGKTDYFKPDNVSSINSYENPMSINGIKAIMIYNAMKSDDMPAINLEERNKIIKISISVDKNKAERIHDKFPEEYAKLIKLLEHPTLGKSINTIALPLDTPVPEWIMEFIDIQGIASDNIKNFPLDSIGVSRMGNDSVNYTNIIKL